MKLRKSASTNRGLQNAPGMRPHAQGVIKISQNSNFIQICPCILLIMYISTDIELFIDFYRGHVIACKACFTFTTPCACGRIPGAFCSPLFVHADLCNFNAVRRTQFYDLIQIVALISLRIVRAIRGTNSHHDKLKM